MRREELVAFARKTAVVLTREVFESKELFAKTRDGTYEPIPPLITTPIAPTIGEALRLYLPTEHGCKTGKQILKRKLFKKLVRARIFGAQRSRLLKVLDKDLQDIYSTRTDQLLFTYYFRGEDDNCRLIKAFNRLLKKTLAEDNTVILILADAASREILSKTRIKSPEQCSITYFDYLYPLILLLLQQETLIIDINDQQYQTSSEGAITEALEYHELEGAEFAEYSMSVTIDTSDYITNRLISLPSNPREAIEQAAITCTKRIIKQFGCIREVHFTEKMYEENDSIQALLRDPIPDGYNQIIQLRAKILRDFPGSDDFVAAVEQLTLAEFASMFIGLHVWRENRGRIL